jgi:glycosyltransferase involved in cell wall biosynthesis
VTPGRVSIITAVYNAARTLEACLLSVRDQSYHDVEHIIIDGGSTDGSVEILERHSSLLAYWVTEPDSGVYDAWNKGLSVATGEWIAFLGADDVLLQDAMTQYLTICGRTDAQYVSSLVRWIRPGLPDKIIGRPWSWPAFQRKMTTAHVGSMHRFDLFEKYGEYDKGYKIAGDYELLLRAGKNLNSMFVEEVTAAMLGGGKSDCFAALREIQRAKIYTGRRNRVWAFWELCVECLKLSVRRVETACASILRAAGSSTYSRPEAPGDRRE